MSCWCSFRNYSDKLVTWLSTQFFCLTECNQLWLSGCSYWVFVWWQSDIKIWWTFIIMVYYCAKNTAMENKAAAHWVEDSNIYLIFKSHSVKVVLLPKFTENIAGFSSFFTAHIYNGAVTAPLDKKLFLMG